jgi:hypothetical protein
LSPLYKRIEDPLKLKRAVLSATFALMTGLLLSASSIPAKAQSASDLSAFLGRWQNNPAKTTLNRYGPNGKNTPRADTYTFVFKPDGPGLRLDVFTEYPQPTPAKTVEILVDGRPHPCLGACIATGTPVDPHPAKLQTYVYTQIDPHLVVRLTYVNGRIEEYLTYAISSDGKTLTQINWSPDTPSWQNVQVFDKQDE